MKRKLISALLALALVVTVIPCNVAFAYDTVVNVDLIVNATVEFMIGHEGNYGSVNCNDSGAVSIGKLQWHAQRALSLLKLIVSKNPTNAKDILGSTLYNEIVNSALSAWKSRSVTSAEATKISTLLTTPEGIAAQDEQAYTDIKGYIDRGYALGIRSDAALMYYCDIENQYGSGNAASVVARAKEALGISSSSTIDSLDQFHNALLSSTSSLVQNYIGRRKTTYNYIVNTLGWNSTGGPAIPSNPQLDCENCPGAAFTDMPPVNHWAHTGIEFVLTRKLFFGTSATTFTPEGEMTRGMLVNVLYNLAETPEVTVRYSFSDVAENAWYANAVSWAVGVGIASGVAEGRFAPEDVVTREQIATMLYNYAKLNQYDTDFSVSLDSYPDGDQASSFAVAPMRWAVAVGLISGETKGGSTRLNPQGAATREQVASILMRYVNYVACG